MPTITIYLTNDLYDKVRDAPSKTVRAALEYYFKSDNTDEPAEAAEDAQQHKKEHDNTHAPPRASLAPPMLAICLPFLTLSASAPLPRLCSRPTPLSNSMS